MPQSVPAVAAELAQAAAAFAHWRDSTPVGARIPEVLWSRAAELAATHGVAKVAATLRLDYVRLKRRVAGCAETARDERPRWAVAQHDRDRPPRCAAVTGAAEARYQERR